MCCFLLGVFFCSKKGQAILRDSPYRAFRREAPAGCRGSRNKMLSPGKGITWPWYGQGRDSSCLHIIFLLYIPQLLLRGLRTFFIRHISALFPDKLQKNTVFSLRAHLPFCGCAFFSFSAAYIFCSGSVRLPSSPENCFSKFQDWRKTE